MYYWCSYIKHVEPSALNIIQTLAHSSPYINVCRLILNDYLHCKEIIWALAANPNLDKPLILSLSKLLFTNSYSGKPYHNERLKFKNACASLFNSPKVTKVLTDKILRHLSFCFPKLDILGILVTIPLYNIDFTDVLIEKAISLYLNVKAKIEHLVKDEEELYSSTICYIDDIIDNWRLSEPSVLRLVDLKDVFITQKLINKKKASEKALTNIIISLSFNDSFFDTTIVETLFNFFRNNTQWDESKKLFIKRLTDAMDDKVTYTGNVSLIVNDTLYSTYMKFLLILKHSSLDDSPEQNSF